MENKILISEKDYKDLVNFRDLSIKKYTVKIDRSCNGKGSRIDGYYFLTNEQVVIELLEKLYIEKSNSNNLSNDLLNTKIELRKLKNKWYNKLLN